MLQSQNNERKEVMKRIYIAYMSLLAYLLVTSCTNDMGVDIKDNGYIGIDLNTLVTTASTRADAPAGYRPKQMYVEVVDASNVVKKSTTDFDNDKTFWDKVEGSNKYLVLQPGTYTVRAHSNGWDGSGSGFDVPYYYGSTKITVESKSLKTATVTCTLANVKVSVTFDESLKAYFKSLKAKVSSALAGVSPLEFVMGTTTASAYFPVGNLNLKLSALNNADKAFEEETGYTITGVKARDHFKVHYKLADSGNIGDGSTCGITVVINDETKIYSYNFEVPKKASTSMSVQNANAWSTFAYLSGKILSKDSSFNAANLKLQYKKSSETTWTDIASSALTIDSKDNVTYTLKGLTAQTSYDYRLCYVTSDSEVFSDKSTFVTEEEIPLYNGGFEYWYVDGKIHYANESGKSYWDSSNQGSANYIGSVTTQETTFVHSGSSAACLATKYAVIKLAAASLFTGKFLGLIGTKGAKLDWGVPFTSRPTALKGYISFTPGEINRGSQPSGTDAPATGEPDACQIYCVLLTEQLHVGGNASTDGYEKSTEIDWQTDPRVIAYGELTKNTSSNGAWEEINIPLEYHTTTQKPAYMMVVFSSSKWGDYFYGSDSSVLYVDDFSFEYGDTPTVKQ